MKAAIWDMSHSQYVHMLSDAKLKTTRVETEKVRTSGANNERLPWPTFVWCYIHGRRRRTLLLIAPLLKRNDFYSD